MSHDELRIALAVWRDAERKRCESRPGIAERNEAERAVARARLAFYRAVARDQEPTTDSRLDTTQLEASDTPERVGFASLTLRNL